MKRYLVVKESTELSYVMKIPFITKKAELGACKLYYNKDWTLKLVFIYNRKPLNVYLKPSEKNDIARKGY